jgi:hypothetical protein
MSIERICPLQLAVRSLALLALTSMVLGLAEQRPKPDQDRSNGGFFQVKVIGERMWLDESDASLATIFDEMVRQSRILLVNRLSREEKITIQFSDVPLAEALSRLADIAIVYAEDVGREKMRILKITVSNRKQSAQSKPPTVDKPDTKEKNKTDSKPFKFVLDPSKDFEEAAPKEKGK